MSKKIHLVYMSAAARPMSEDELAEILARSRENNARLNITGMLAYHLGSFLQVLEGPEEAVGTLYQRISQDPRHTKCELLLRNYIDRRSFAEWQMGFVDTHWTAAEQAPGFIDLFGRHFSRELFVREPATAQKLLLAFRDGSWRQLVETDADSAMVAGR